MVQSPISAGMSPPAESTSTVSEKARGKMKARRSVSMDATGSLERIAAAGVGKNGFVPTQEWVRSSWSELSFTEVNYSHRSHLGSRGEI
jgi:hypothetical protein